MGVATPTPRRAHFITWHTTAISNKVAGPLYYYLYFSVFKVERRRLSMLETQTRATLSRLFLYIGLLFGLLQAVCGGFGSRTATRERDQEWTVTNPSSHSIILIVGIATPLLLLVVLFWIRFRQAKREREQGRRSMYHGASHAGYTSRSSPVQLWMPSPRQAVPIQTLSEANTEWSQCKMMPPPPPPYSSHRHSPL